MVVIHFFTTNMDGIWKGSPFILVRVRGQDNCWLLGHLFVRFTRIFYFHLNVAFSSRFDLVSAFSFFMCECGHELDTFDMHLTHCLFGG
jgi:hypothetical protein